MSPCAEHTLDWFHIAMRLTVLGQYAKGLAHHDRKEAEEIETDLEKINGICGMATSARRCSGPRGWRMALRAWRTTIRA